MEMGDLPSSIGSIIAATAADGQGDMRDLFLLDPEVVFLNHGSFGACPRPVFEAYQRFQRELERQPIEFLARERRLPELLEPARLRLAEYVGAPPGDLVFTTNASSALNTAIRSLELRAGDEVLLGDAEYGGLNVLWDWVAARTGATLRRVPFDDLVPGPRTRIVFCSHVEWTTGRVNDVSAVCDAARAAGAISIVDGAHAPGQIDVDISATGADIYAGNCHKWLCAPKGSAFLYAHPQIQARIEPPVVSWDFADDAPFSERHRWQGTRDPAAYLSVPAAIGFQAEHDWPAVRARCHALLEAFRDACTLEPLTDRFVQMLGFRLPVEDGKTFQRELYERHRIEVPVFDVNGSWALRVSVQAYNDEADLDALRAAVARVVPRRPA
jgi:isopenicillin-N epimerase